MCVTYRHVIVRAARMRLEVKVVDGERDAAVWVGFDAPLALSRVRIEVGVVGTREATFRRLQVAPALCSETKYNVLLV